MNDVVIAKVVTSKQSCKTGEKITIQVWAYTATDNITRRMPLRMGYDNKTIKA